jgi:hypothetical protein
MRSSDHLTPSPKSRYDGYGGQKRWGEAGSHCRTLSSTTFSLPKQSEPKYCHFFGAHINKILALRMCSGIIAMPQRVKPRLSKSKQRVQMRHVKDTPFAALTTIHFLYSSALPINRPTKNSPSTPRPTTLHLRPCITYVIP